MCMRSGEEMTPAEKLRTRLKNARSERRCLTVPACHDAMSAILISRAGFEVAFMSGFAVSATALAMPDAGLISYGEQVQVARNICDATRSRGLLVIGDGDTGFGGSGNVRRTLRGYAAAGLAGISVEDQVYPKRCSYARGLAVENRERAIARVRSAVSARNEMREECGLDLVLIARTDCRNCSSGGGLEEAIARCVEFARLGADVVYAEGLKGAAELKQLNEAMARTQSGMETPLMIAQVERPGVVLVQAEEAARLGYTLSLLGLTVLNVALRAMKDALAEMAAGRHPADEHRMPFDELYAEVGFPAHYAWEERFEEGTNPVPPNIDGLPGYGRKRKSDEE